MRGIAGKAGRWRRAFASVGALAAVVGFADAAAAGTIVSFQIQPSDPTTWDNVKLSAVVSLPQDCAWKSAARIGFGPQPELAPDPGWGLDLEIDGTAATCQPVPVQVPVHLDLGNLPVAGGSGVLRLMVDAILSDTKPFQLFVAPGPAPGWGEPAAHGGFIRFTRSNGVSFVPEGLLISDVYDRAMVVVDPETGASLRAFESPGTGDVRGLAFDGTSLLASVLNGVAPTIYRLNLQGVILDSFASPVVSGNVRPLESLAVLKGVLYGTYDAPPLLFAIDPVSHHTLWERDLPDRIYGLEASPEGLLGSSADGTIYFIEPSSVGTDVVLADGLDTGIPGTPDISSVAYDGFGMVLWDRSPNVARRLRTFALWWAVDGTLQSYLPDEGLSLDVIRGDVENLQFGGSYIDLGPTVCLVADGAGGTVPSAGNPSLGRAFFYLARFLPLSGFDTFYGRSFPLGLRRIHSYDSCP